MANPTATTTTTVSAPAATSTTTVSPSATTTATHTNLFEKVFDWTEHTAEEIDSVFAGLSAQQIVNAIPAGVYQSIAAMLPAPLENGVKSLASYLSSAQTSALANWLGTTDLAFVMLFLERIAAPTTATAAPAVTAAPSPTATS
jgi:hypothetical protein